LPRAPGSECGRNPPVAAAVVGGSLESRPGGADGEGAYRHGRAVPAPFPKGLVFPVPALRRVVVGGSALRTVFRRKEKTDFPLSITVGIDGGPLVPYFEKMILGDRKSAVPTINPPCPIALLPRLPMATGPQRSRSPEWQAPPRTSKSRGKTPAPGVPENSQKSQPGEGAVEKLRSAGISPPTERTCPPPWYLERGSGPKIRAQIKAPLFGGSRAIESTAGGPRKPLFLRGGLPHLSTKANDRTALPRFSAVGSQKAAE